LPCLCRDLLWCRGASHFRIFSALHVEVAKQDLTPFVLPNSGDRHGGVPFFVGRARVLKYCRDGKFPCPF
jgi:hypothetical protein